ncbi:hypothetical protein VNI00_015523 [Paramarasmius palmivorus]|uniref:Uncharacterized protein n=1 Tax=Paramarasmius palmivorus TaxID=297713 RepID=A0AAW0BIP3_9AGAR
MAPRIHVLEPACGPTPPFRRAPTKKRLQSDDEISISSASTSESSASPNPPNTAAGVKRKAPPKISPSRRRPYKRKPPREVSSSNMDEGDVVEITHTDNPCAENALPEESLSAKKTTRATTRATRSSTKSITSSKKGRSSSSKDSMLRGITGTKASLAKYAVISSLKATQKKVQSAPSSRRASKRLLSSKTSKEPTYKIKTRSQTRHTASTVPAKRKALKSGNVLESSNKRLCHHVNSSQNNQNANALDVTSSPEPEDRDTTNPGNLSRASAALPEARERSVPPASSGSSKVLPDDQDFVDGGSGDEMDSEEEESTTGKHSDLDDMVLVSDLCDIDMRSFTSSTSLVPNFPNSNIPFLKLLDPHSIATLTSDVQISLAALHQDRGYKDIQEIV